MEYFNAISDRWENLTQALNEDIVDFAGQGDLPFSLFNSKCQIDV